MIILTRHAQTFVLSFWIFVISSSCGSQEAAESAEIANKQPNIVLIVADDLGYGDLSINGATKISTPSIDSLARGGMNFNNAHVVSSICTPSRYSILTGRYSWRTRMKHGVAKYYEKPLIEEDETTLATMLKEKGYRTAVIGKWHLGMDWELNANAPENPEKTVFDSWDNNLYEYIDFSKPVKNGPTARGFDYFYGMAGSNNMQPYVHIENDSVLLPPSVPQKKFDHYSGVFRAPNWNINTINEEHTHKAVDVINDHFATYKEDPLFLYFPTSAIHRPCLPTFTKGQSEAGLRGDIVEELDWTVAQIVKALKENGEFENTLLIFTSDNGPRPGDPALWMRTYAEGDYEDFHQDYFEDYAPEYVNENGNLIWREGWFTYGHDASGDMRGFKSDSWQGAFKVPFIVHWPGSLDAGKVNTNYISTVDLMATFAEILRIDLEPSAGVDSYSFLSNLQNVGSPQVRTSMVLAGGASGAMVVIKDGWKYIEAAPEGRWPETYYPDGPSHLEPQLYNINEDPSEENNLYAKMPDKVQEMKDHLEKIKNNPKLEANGQS